MASRKRLVPLAQEAARRHSTGVNPPVVARGVLLVNADRGSRAREALAMQRLVGNAAVQRAIGESTAEGHGTCTTPSMECTAKAIRSYDSAANLKSVTTTKDEQKNVVYKATAVGTATFKSDVEIHLATVPDGLSECATKKLQALIDKKLKPHELDHKQRFLTTKPKHAYIGKWKETFTAIAGDRGTAESEAVAKAELGATDQESKRIDRNDDYAINAIDPFSVTADISDCDECKGDAGSD